MRRKEWSKEELKIEWDKRAMRPGEMAVMSSRFPADELNAESRRYADAVIGFIGDDIDNKDVLEVGCGIGRITERLVARVGNLTCLEPSAKMIERNKLRLGAMARSVNYIEVFADEYIPRVQHDVAVCSLVLNHNPDNLLLKIAEVISNCAGLIFLFEHTGRTSETSEFTYVRSESKLLAFFGDFHVVKRDKYMQFTDELSFLKLLR